MDPGRIALWGYSLSAAEALVAASLDAKRIKLVVAVCPAVPLDVENDVEKRKSYLTQAIQDRESRARGNPPFYIPYIGDTDDGPAIFNYLRFRGVNMGNDFYDSSTVFDQIFEIMPNFQNSITVQTFYNVVTWNFLGFLRVMPPRVPVLQICAAEEEVDSVKKSYQTIFDLLPGPKEFHTEPDKGHINILSDDDERFQAFMELQTNFVWKYLGDKE